MNRLFYFLSIIVVGLGVSSCQQKTATSNSTDVETNTTIDQSTIASDIKEFEQIKQEEVDKLNTSITHKKLSNVEDIMRYYAPEDKGAEGKYTYDITVLQMADSALTLVTLVEDGINDDSIRAKKVVMTLKEKEGQYQVTQIKQSYQCWEGRGHTTWNSSYCK
ncbi:hypothetical protein [Myroides sp. DW712]|uniref:hypothetical protein n=1 Tax=Myroides sp. DW712 TaxID=3389800 RepID=UPI0039787B28